MYHGTESIFFVGPKICKILPDNFKKMEIVESFKRTTKTWKPETCPCRLCKVLVQNIGFL